MAVKKWITKTDIKALLNTYSVRKDEFREVAEYTYMNNCVKGYMLTIQEEFSGNDKTGRIIVAHTQQSGKKSFNDIWERGTDGKLQFRFRNPWNCPPADLEYIKDLEQRNEELRVAGQLLQKANVSKKHNERNAGRRKGDDKWIESFNKFVELYESRKTMEEIMEETGISRSTYFRYQKLYKETGC